MSGWVRDKYCKLPTMLRNRVRFSKARESNFERDTEAAIGEETAVAPLKPIFCNKSEMCKKNPSWKVI